MSSAVMSPVQKRQSSGGLGNDVNEDWWWSDTGVAIRYAIVACLFALVLLYILGGYIHARRRVRNNLPPLAYHRWMVRRAHQPNVIYMQYHQNAPHGYQQAYPMSDYPPPPPAYNSADAPPPVYQPPAGASKVLADQSYAGSAVRAGEGSSSANYTVAPPPGPPPGR